MRRFLPDHVSSLGADERSPVQRAARLALSQGAVLCCFARSSRMEDLRWRFFAGPCYGPLLDSGSVCFMGSLCCVHVTAIVGPAGPGRGLSQERFIASNTAELQLRSVGNHPQASNCRSYSSEPDFFGVRPCQRF